MYEAAVVQTYVAFLRALNVGGRTVKKGELVAAFESIGLCNVSTFIASGNVIFETSDSDDLEALTAAALNDTLSFEVPTFVRSGQELLATLQAQPFGHVETNIEVSFLSSKPTPEDSATLEASVAAPDQLRVIGREVYWLRHGRFADSEHTEAATNKTLGTDSTVRNLRTIIRIANRYLGA